MRSQRIEEDLAIYLGAGFREHARETLRVPQYKAWWRKSRKAQPLRYTVTDLGSAKARHRASHSRSRIMV
jgi:hypothetical protein